MGADPDCLFCRIVAGELPSHRVREDERTVAFLDIAPATRGHALVVPRAHARDVHAMADDDLGACALAAREIATLARERLGADGVTIMQSNGAAAGQEVFHYHVHVVPRYAGDPLRLPWGSGKQPQDDLDSIRSAYVND